jgi:hypothetical protein
MDYTQSLGSNRGGQAVPAPEVRVQGDVIGWRRLGRRKTLDGAMDCDTAGVYFLLGSTCKRS